VWSWDITKLLGPAKWKYFYLYVLLDIFSRYVVGWTIAHRESATLAKKLIEESCARQGITPGQLAIHADRGPSMTSRTIAHLYADLGVTQSHSRPNVSNDNPFSEAQFKTLKYRPDFPERFGSAQHGRAHCGPFFSWYNCEHRHGGIGLLTPHDVHDGLADQRVAARARVLVAAHAAHPERFSAGVPPGTTHRRLDQPTNAGIERHRGDSLNSNQGCLILVDRFRCASALAIPTDALGSQHGTFCGEQPQDPHRFASQSHSFPQSYRSGDTDGIFPRVIDERWCSSRFRAEGDVDDPHDLCSKRETPHRRGLAALSVASTWADLDRLRAHWPYHDTVVF
jgi:hypothetical protein